MQIYQADPLLCPKCHGEMRIIASIDKDGDPEISDLGYLAAGSGSGPDDARYNMLYPQEY